MATMKFIFLIQARLGASRYPGKVLELLDGDKTLLEHVYARTLMAKRQS